MINMKEENQESPLMDDETIEIFVPIKIVRKRGVALIIEPKNIKKEEKCDERKRRASEL